MCQCWKWCFNVAPYHNIKTTIFISVASSWYFLGYPHHLTIHPNIHSVISNISPFHHKTITPLHYITIEHILPCSNLSLISWSSFFIFNQPSFTIISMNQIFFQIHVRFVAMQLSSWHFLSLELLYLIYHEEVKEVQNFVMFKYGNHVLMNSIECWIVHLKILYPFDSFFHQQRYKY